MLLSLLSVLLPLPPKRLWTQLLKWACSVEVEQSPGPQDVDGLCDSSSAGLAR